MPDRILILAVFVVASCGLAYELVAGALTSYLLGDSILQFSTIIGCYLFAMGIGSHLSRYVKDDLIIRLKKPISAADVDRLNGQFSRLLRDGKMTLRGPYDVEVDHKDLPRLCFTHHRRDFGTVRRLIDAINECTPA